MPAARGAAALATAAFVVLAAGCGGGGAGETAARGLSGEEGVTASLQPPDGQSATTSTPPPAAPVPAQTGSVTSPPPAATPPDAAAGGRDPRLDVQLGAVNVSDLHVYRYGRELTITLAVDRPSVAVIGVFDRRGAALTQGSVRRRTAGPLVARLRLPRPQGRLRVVLSLIPPNASPTVISLRTQPARPRVRVVAPRPGQVIRGDRVRVRIETEAFRVTDQGTRPRPRQGHFHITLDNRSYVVHYGKEMTFEGLRNGRHRLLVVPARNDHAAVPGLDPIVVNFRVASGVRLEPQRLSRRTYRMLPRPAAEVGLRPALAWSRIPRARKYRVQVRDAVSGRRVWTTATPARTVRVPGGRLRPGRVHVWSVGAVTPRGGILVGRSWFRTR